MAEYISKEQALMQLTGKFPEDMSLEKYIGLVNFRINELDAADVIERSKIDKAKKEIENIGMGSYLEFIKEIECNNREVRLSKKFAIAILDKLITERGCEND